MIDQPFRIVGRVLNSVTSRGAAGLRVEAWDMDVKIHDRLGSATTDSEGYFRIGFGPSAFFEPYTVDNLPDIYFKIYYGRNLIKTTQDTPLRNVGPGEIRAELSVELFVELMDSGGPSLPSPTQTGPSVEVALHELGQSIAVTVASVQRELSRYPNTVGTYVLDEIDLSIPVQVRVDSLGQVLTTVAQGDITNKAVGNIHLRLRPVLGAVTPPPIIADQSLDTLGLPEEAVAKLKSQRIFSVEDLLRVSSTGAGRTSLENQLTEYGDPSKVLDSAALLTMPRVPSTISESLLKLGYTRTEDFMTADRRALAAKLTEQLGQPVSADDVWYWQNELQQASRVPLPSADPEFQRPSNDDLVES